MSGTLAGAAVNIRQLLNDDNPARYMVDTPRLYRLIATKALEWPHKEAAWVASAFTLTAGSMDDYTLPSSVQYYRVLGMRFPEIGCDLEPATPEEMSAMRAGIDASTGAGGDPTHYMVWEDAGQVVNVRVNTVPSRALAVDVLRSAMPAKTFTGATAIPFSDEMLSGIEMAVAASVANMVPAEWLAERGIEKSVVADWKAESEALRRAGLERISRIMQPPVRRRAVSF